MARWFVSLLLMSSFCVAGSASANTKLLGLLSDNQSYTPLTIITQVEKEYSGTVAEIEAEEHRGELVYELKMVNISDRTLMEFEFNGSDGKLLKQKVKRLDMDDDEVIAVKLLESMQLSFSDLVKQALGSRQTYIREAELDHDLGISYLELKLIDQYGRHKIAYDIKNQRPLPLLKWD